MSHGVLYILDLHSFKAKVTTVTKKELYAGFNFSLVTRIGIFFYILYFITKGVSSLTLGQGHSVQYTYPSWQISCLGYIFSLGT